MKIQKRLGRLLAEKEISMAVAESCTGGLIGAEVTSVEGSSAYFSGGVIAYENRVKRDVLGVSQKDLDAYGAVSSQVVKQMASGVAKLLGCDCSVSVSGVAGPGGGSPEKPVGLVYTGAYYNNETISRRFVFSGSREQVRRQSVTAALEHLFHIINN
ncbi:MAG: CinA family protein [Chitinispirillaceae bacterium]